MSMLRQLRSIFPGAKKTPDESEPCTASCFIASRIKRQGTATPFPREADPKPSEDTHFTAELMLAAADRLDHPPPASAA